MQGEVSPPDTPEDALTGALVIRFELCLIT